jgi:hypothetical protein
MMLTANLLLLSIGLFTAGCKTPGSHDAGDALFIEIEAIVVLASGGEVTLSTTLPEDIAGMIQPSVKEIADQIVLRGLLLEGLPTHVNNLPVTIKSVRGRQLTISGKGIKVLRPGNVISLSVPRKTIVIMDLDVMRGRDRKAGKVMLEELKSALIETGQFAFVERSKLAAVSGQAEPGVRGLTYGSSEKMGGKLPGADLILTGTLVEANGEWDVDLRLINARTGKTHATIIMRTAGFDPDAMREPESAVRKRGDASQQ